MNQWNVGVYIRLSQEDGDKEESNSITNQRELINNYIQEDIELKFYDYYIDDGWSGTNFNRPDFKRLINDIETGVINTIIVKDLSRFGRNYIEVGNYLEQIFPLKKVRFLGLVDNSDTDVVENKKSRQINGLVNEWMVEDTSKNTRATLNSMKRNGQFTGSFAPYGYFIDPNDKHHLIPDPHARQAIKIMAGMLKQGKSMQSVIEVLMRKKFLTPADYKTSLGIPINRGTIIKSIRYKVEEGETLQSIADKFYVTRQEIKEKSQLTTNKVKEGDILIIPHKQKWTGHMIRKIVTDETQIGSLVQGKTERTSFKNKKPIPKPKEEWIIVPHCHEANLDLETFNAVNALFKENTRNRSQKNGEVPLFSKKVYCACCGKAFNKNSAHVKEGTKEYLQCRGNSAQNGHICDNSETVDLEELKTYVLDCIKEKISNYFNLSKVNKEYYLQNVYSNIDNDIKQLEKDKANIELEINDKKNILVQLYADKVNGTLEVSEFNIIKESNTQKIEELQNKLISIDTEIANLTADKAKQIDKAKLFEQYKNISELNKVVLDAFISKIVIGKPDSETTKRPINIDWNLYTA